jgi:hypothetical protein
MEGITLFMLESTRDLGFEPRMSTELKLSLFALLSTRRLATKGNVEEAMSVSFTVSSEGRLILFPPQVAYSFTLNVDTSLSFPPQVEVSKPFTQKAEVLKEAPQLSAVTAELTLVSMVALAVAVYAQVLRYDALVLLLS